MQRALTLLTLNIERSNHLERVMHFLDQNKPDIICLQEVMEDDYEDIKKQLGYDGIYQFRVAFRPGFYVDGRSNREGIAILSRYPINHHSVRAYDPITDPIPQFTHSQFDRPDSRLLIAGIDANDALFRVAATHFPWSPMGKVTDDQRQNMADMLEILNEYNDLILCGDFNTPRGDELFDRLAIRYRDNIPSEVSTTVDQNLHRVKGLQLVVDGIFTTPHYTVENVQILQGLSDHCGVIATITSSLLAQ